MSNPFRSPPSSDAGPRTGANGAPSSSNSLRSIPPPPLPPRPQSSSISSSSSIYTVHQHEHESPPLPDREDVDAINLSVPSAPSPPSSIYSVSYQYGDHLDTPSLPIDTIFVDGSSERASPQPIPVPASLDDHVPLPVSQGPSAVKVPTQAPPKSPSTVRKLRDYPFAREHVRYDLEIGNVPYKPWTLREFKPKQWLTRFHHLLAVCQSRNDLFANGLRIMRLHIQLDTIEAFALPEDPRSGSIRSLMEQTKHLSSEFNSYARVKEWFTSQPLHPAIDPPASSKTVPLMKRILLINCDSLDAGLACSKYGFTSCVLNMGNPAHRGGGFKTGSAAQEESLFRRTNLYYRLGHISEATGLEKSFSTSTDLTEYRTPSKASSPFNYYNDTIYTSSAIVVRAPEFTGYDWLPKPQLLDILTACAIPRRQPSSVPYSPQEAQQMEEIIESILMRALLEGRNAIVLGALGCGAFNNPPEEVAQIFKKKLVDEGMAHYFKLVVFAIVEDQNSGGINLQSFTKAFDTSVGTISDIKAAKKFLKKKK